jgi:hypothetical protein
LSAAGGASGRHSGGRGAPWAPFAQRNAALYSAFVVHLAQKKVDVGIATAHLLFDVRSRTGIAAFMKQLLLNNIYDLSTQLNYASFTIIPTFFISYKPFYLMMEQVEYITIQQIQLYFIQVLQQL